MNRFFDMIERLSRYAGYFCMAAMCVCIFLQVIFRYCLHNSLVWSEEIARFFFIWLVYAAISCAMSKGSHLKIDSFVSLLPPAPRKVLDFLMNLLTTAFLGALIFHSVDFTRNVYNTHQLATSVDMPLWIVWALLDFFLILTFFQSVRLLVRGRNGREA